MNKVFLFIATIAIFLNPSLAFTVQSNRAVIPSAATSNKVDSLEEQLSRSTKLQATPDYETISLVTGQENYGLAIVALGEAVWSFSEAPSLSNAKVFIPAAIAAIILVSVSGPMVTNAADPAAIGLGLEIATGISVFLGLSYIARLLAPFSPSAKEIAFLGLLVSIAGFFSFSQNLVVDGFINLPDLPKLPSFFPKNQFED